MTTMRLLRSALAVTLLSAAAACGDDTLTGVDADVFGTYTLASIDGLQLPYIYDDGASITGGRLELHSDGDIDGRIDGREPDGSDASDDFEGTYRVSGTTITITLTDEGEDETFSATLSNGTLTIPDEETGDWVFRK